MLAAAAAGITLFPHVSPAATQTWNPGLSTIKGTDGAGTWDNGVTADWYDGTADVWTNGNTAIIGAGTGAAGTITLGAGVTAGGITFNAAGSGNYTISGSNSLSLTSGATITDNATGTTTIGVNLDQAGSPTLNFAGAGTLAITGNIGISSAPVGFNENAAGGIVNLSGTNYISGNAGGATATVQAGTLQISGGTTTVTAANALDIGNGAAATGFNMTGGTLSYAGADRHRRTRQQHDGPSKRRCDQCPQRHSVRWRLYQRHRDQHLHSLRRQHQCLLVKFWWNGILRRFL